MSLDGVCIVRLGSAARIGQPPYDRCGELRNWHERPRLAHDRTEARKAYLVSDFPTPCPAAATRHR